MPRSGPPAYAWDWFARQRLLWREVHRRLTARAQTRARYGALEERGAVLALLRTDYLRDPTVRGAVDQTVAELAFLGRTDRRFRELGFTSAPRGLRWWWTALTGEELDSLTPEPSEPLPRQPTFDDITQGYGDHHPPR